MKVIFPLLLVTVILLCASSVSADRVDDLAGMLKSALEPVVTEWRYTSSDILNAELPSFDDTRWKTGRPEFDWGHEPVAWMRTTIIIPERLAGISTKGATILLKVAVDDAGIIYVEGKEAARFDWDKGRAVLTENAVPGQKICVAIKGINTNGPGRLMNAWLENASLEDIRPKVMSYLFNLQLAKSLLGEENQSVMASLKAVNPDALLKDGDKKRFLKSIEAAEHELVQTGPRLKEFTCHLVGHAHIDMNWLWLWPETVEVCRNTFSTVDKLMEEYPDFCFSQSQPSTYVAVEETDPELFSRIQKRVKEGRWEITGGTWVEGDMNLASGESIVRQILLAKMYFKEKFGVEPRICWEPDTFGHAWTIPQILKKSNIDFYYFMRCGKGKPLFWWESPDGSRVLAFNDDNYNGNVTTNIAKEMADLHKSTGVKDHMAVYGVGDHGGGPTKEMIQSALELRKRPVFPSLKFDTALGFFESVLEKEGANIPVIRDELNFEFRGCYTSHSDIKKMNRTLENILPEAEVFQSICKALEPVIAGPVPDTDKKYLNLNLAWRNTCFNQFHDIFDGTAIHGAYDYSKELFDKAYADGRAELDRTTAQLVSAINTQGDGIPIVVFNPLAWDRTDAVQVKSPLNVETTPAVVVSDGQNTYPAQIDGDELLFTAHDIPAMGYKVFWLKPADEEPPSTIKSGDDWIENEFFRIKVDSKTGAISSIFDKQAGREVVQKGRQAGELHVLFEESTGMSAWNLGQILDTKVLNVCDVSEVLGNGPSRALIRSEHTFDKSNFVQDVILYEGVPRIDIQMTADWQQIGTKDSGRIPMIKAAFPVDISNPKAFYEIPFGSIERPVNGNEVPAQKWADLSNGVYGISLLNDCKYGYDAKDNTLRLSLLRASHYPDPVPDKGIHEMTYSLYPHKGDWREAKTPRKAYELNNPLIAVVTDTHNGPLTNNRSFISVEPANLIVTALKPAEDGRGLILRFFETNGAPVTAEINTSLPAKSCNETNLIEQDLRSLQSTGSSIKMPVNKWEIKTLRLIL